LRCGAFKATLLAIQTSLPRPGTLQVIAHAEVQPPQSFGLDFDQVAVLERVQAAVIRAGSKDVARFQGMD
jgi:hypothetical protein